MPIYSLKSQYTEKNKRIIYIMKSPLSKEFFVGHCKNTLLKDVYKQHFRGDRQQTKVCFQILKKQNLRPCLFILEEIESTKTEAYHHVIAWTKIFFEAGYTNLDQGNISTYMNDLYKKSYAVYTANKDTDLGIKCNCDTCVVSNYGRKKCPLYKGEGE